MLWLKEGMFKSMNLSSEKGMFRSIKTAWITDPHLEFLDNKKIEVLCSMIKEHNTNYIFITGDISTSSFLLNRLKLLETKLEKPIYFVLGNHDYYYGSIIDVRKRVKKFVTESKLLRWMTSERIIELTNDTCVIGHDGWGDGRFGNIWDSNVMMSDFQVIKELHFLIDKKMKIEKLGHLGDEAANHFYQILPEAIDKYRNIIVLTHIPPFIEACWHEGKISDDSWLPYFSCKAAGDALYSVMIKNPDNNMTVLCGHTHSGRECQILPNLKVITGAAEYGIPSVTGIFQFGISI
jgi:predicted MPP superfamily phosphohydrolase